jgi:hypothetical protein
MARVERVPESALTQQRLQFLRKQDVRARSCAALVFAFHAGLRRPPAVRPGASAPNRAAPLRKRLAPASAAGFATAPDELLDEQPTRTAYEILKWVGMIAAVAAPWVLLLTG